MPYDCDDDYEDYDGHEPSCTHCGGESFMEANEAYCDWINFGDEWVPCPYCRGTGLRKHQSVF
jgi:DnaJ-class molecular chaperone